MTTTSQNSPAVSVPHVAVINGIAKTTSLQVAEFFGKQHKNIIQRIESLDCSPEFTTANFSAVARKVQAGIHEREVKFYEMTKDGFTFLVMGFTGKEAARFKEAYITRFNEMEAALRESSRPAIASASLTPAQQRHIQHTVAALTKLHGRSFQAVYGSIKDHFRVGTYKDIPADQYPALCKFLSVEPLAGEYIPRRPDPVISEADLVNLSAMTTHALVVSREWKEVILPMLEAAGSRHIGRMYDHFVSLGFVAGMFRTKYREEFAALHADEMTRRGMEEPVGRRGFLG